jgi:hypothetical protein
MKKITFLFAIVFLFGKINAQTVRYTSLYNDTTLSETADDIILLLSNAGISGPFSKVTLGAGNPSNGILLRIDTTLIATQRVQQCSVLCNGTNKIEFIASSSFGVRYGVYAYLAKLGFKFYGPDELWEIIPNLTSAYQTIDTTYATTREYHSFYGSGGYMPNAIDPANAIYNTEYEKKWRKYSVRNNMVNEYDFAGHNGEGWVQSNLGFLQQNPCYIAEYNGSNEPVFGSTPNMFNQDALQHWTNYVKSNYDISPNIPWYNARMSIEQADNTMWGNTNDNACISSSWPSPSDQNFTIANYVTNDFQNTIARPFRTTCFAYYAHADTPSVAIHPYIQVLVVNGFQSLTSQVGLLNRWKIKHNSFLEYNYLALPDWDGQSPFTNFSLLHQQARRINTWNTLGVMTEGTYSVFACALHQNAFQKGMVDGSDVSMNFANQIDELFGSAAPKVKELYDLWNTDGFHFTSYWLNHNMPRMPIYHKLIKEADDLASNPKEKSRINRLKAYYHYLVLLNEMRIATNPVERDLKSQEFLNYHLGIANVSQQINNTISNYSLPATYDIWWNNWSTSADSLLPFGFREAPFLAQAPYTETEISSFFDLDGVNYELYYDYKLLKPDVLIQKACELNLIPKDSITIDIEINEGGMNYNLYAPNEGSIRINYTFNTSEDIPFTVVLDSDDQMYSTEKTVNPATTSSGFIDLTIPSAGFYKFEIDYFFGANASIFIVSNGNYLYKTFPAIPVLSENYTTDINSFSHYNYIPIGIDKLYLNIEGSNGDTSLLNLYFKIYDGQLNQKFLNPTLNPDIYYVDVDSANQDAFWKFYSNLNYPFSIVNTSNIPFVLEPGICSLGIKEQKNLKTFRVYPNPSNGNFTIERNSSFENENITISDFSGRKILTQKTNNGSMKHNLNCENLAKGVYFVTIENSKGIATSIQKIIIN